MAFSDGQLLANAITEPSVCAILTLYALSLILNTLYECRKLYYCCYIYIYIYI